MNGSRTVAGMTFAAMSAFSMQVGHGGQAEQFAAIFFSAKPQLQCLLPSPLRAMIRARPAIARGLPAEGLVVCPDMPTIFLPTEHF